MRRHTRATPVALLAILLLALVVLVMRLHAMPGHIAATVTAPLLPGMTLADDDDNGQIPVVTSLRSDSEAERLGLRVGDHIAAIDGRPVRNVAALRAAIVDRRGAGPVALHVRRGNAVWNVALDRAEPAEDANEDGNRHHDAQNPAG